MGAFIDMVGQQYGRWVVLRIAGRDKGGEIVWLCRCVCGRERVVKGGSLRRGSSKGCASCAQERNATHGGSGTRLYVIWRSMRTRCDVESHPTYKNYGGRGIAVCREWNKSFEAFRDWALANGYKQGLTIDRIDNDGNYEPDNCRWATMKQQNRNARSNIHVTINGITKLLCEWAEVAGIKYITLWRRVNRGWCPERLLSPPKGGGIHHATKY